jgi:hypothetical protein
MATEMVVTERATELATEVATAAATEVVATEVVATEMAMEVATEGWVTGAVMGGWVTGVVTGRLAMGAATEAIGAISTRIDPGLVSTSGGSESLLDDLLRHPSTRVFGGRALLSCVEQQRALLGFLKTLSGQLPKMEGQKGDPSGLQSNCWVIIRVSGDGQSFRP